MQRARYSLLRSVLSTSFLAFVRFLLGLHRYSFVKVLLQPVPWSSLPLTLVSTTQHQLTTPPSRITAQLTAGPPLSSFALPVSAAILRFRVSLLSLTRSLRLSNSSGPERTRTFDPCVISTVL